MGLGKRATRWVMRNRRRQLSPTVLIAQFRAGVEQLTAEFPALLRGSTAEHYESLRAHYEEQGVHAELAEALAVLADPPDGAQLHAPRVQTLQDIAAL